MKDAEPQRVETADSPAADSRTAAQRAAAVSNGARTAVAEAQQARTPDFFIIGHQKCGTTALYYMLRDHPQIYLPRYKEPRFFAPELRPPRRLETPDCPQTLERYLALFADARPGQRIGETSPQYIRSPTAASRIAELSPGARIIAILREPVAFLRSYHMQMVASHVETEKDFRKAISLEGSRRQGAAGEGSFLPPQWLYSDHVRYAGQLARFRSAFSSEQILVLIYDDFRRDNEHAVHQIQRFLGVDDSVPIAPVETEPLEAVRSMRLHQLGRTVRGGNRAPGPAGALARAVVDALPEGIRHGTLARAFNRLAYTSPEPPDADFTLELRRRFKAEVEAISDDLGRDLVSLWGYDKLD
jgi:hypothetical protein